MKTSAKFLMASVAAAAVLSGCGGSGSGTVVSPAPIDPIVARRDALNAAAASNDLVKFTAEMQKAVGPVLQLPTTAGVPASVLALPVGTNSGRVSVDGNLNGNAIVHYAFNAGEKNADGSGDSSPSILSVGIANGKIITTNTDNGGIFGQRWNGLSSSVYGRMPTNDVSIKAGVANAATYFGVSNTTPLSSRQPARPALGL
jgi:hypothetical protein